MMGAKQRQSIVTKGGESGETAAESHGQEELPAFLYACPSVGNAIKQADKQAT